MAKRPSSFDMLGIDEFDIRNIFSEFIPEFSVSSIEAGTYVTADSEDDFEGFKFIFVPKIKVVLVSGVRYQELVEIYRSGAYDQFLADIRHRLTIYNLEINSSTNSPTSYPIGVKVNGNQLEILIYRK